MTVPTPNIRPERIAGGIHTARYVGAVGVSGGGGGGGQSVGIKAEGVAICALSPTLPLLVPTQVMVRDEYFDVVSTAPDPQGLLLYLRAVEPGPSGNLPINTEVHGGDGDGFAVDEFQNFGRLRVATTGGEIAWQSSGDPSAVGLVVDLRDLPLNLRTDKYFVDQVRVIVQILDQGLDIQPRVLDASDFHGSPIEYLTLEATSDSEANQCIVIITLPHTHER